MKEKLKEAFKVELPPDFFDFWQFCKTFKSENPCGKCEVYFVLFSWICLIWAQYFNQNVRPNPIMLCKLVYQLSRECVLSASSQMLLCSEFLEF